MNSVKNHPELEIRRRISLRGRISFAEFMEIALFWPEGGYYTGESPVGATGDYYTSPSVHPAFAALLATQLFQVWDLMGRPVSFHIIETGAGNGLLAKYILSRGPVLSKDFAKAIKYVCLDYRSSTGLETDVFMGENSSSVDRLSAVMPTHRLVDDKASSSNLHLPLSGVTGCVISNELLDAFPVHQVTVHKGLFQEIFVSITDQQFIQTLGRPSCPELSQRLRRQGVDLKEGQVAEINLGIDRWASEISSILDFGYVITIDYGDTAKRLYSFSERPDGCLTTYYKHTQIDDPFQHIGSQDITSQVDFSTVVKSGIDNGLAFLGYSTQGQFLNNLGLDIWRRELGRTRISAREEDANRAGILDLVRPGGLGEFKVLLQGKRVTADKLWGFNTESGFKDSMDMVRSNPVPFLTSDHIQLLEGRYTQPEPEIILDELWPPGLEQPF